jgi:hypothetical protein
MNHAYDLVKPKKGLHQKFGWFGGIVLSIKSKQPCSSRCKVLQRSPAQPNPAQALLCLAVQNKEKDMNETSPSSRPGSVSNLIDPSSNHTIPDLSPDFPPKVGKGIPDRCVVR